MLKHAVERSGLTKSSQTPRNRSVKAAYATFIGHKTRKPLYCRLSFVHTGMRNWIPECMRLVACWNFLQKERANHSYE